MPVWLTYSLSDFLLFSPQTYFRLFEIYNRAIWPGQIVAIALGIAILVLLRRPTVASGRTIAAILGACWLWVAWAYLQQRYATINWAASYAAAAFAAQAVLLLAAAAFGQPVFRVGTDLVGRIGLGLLLFSLLVQPLTGTLLGRPWAQVELFGVAPDPTAVATLGVLLLTTRRRFLALSIVPLLWCAASATTLWAMQAPEAWVMIAAAAIASVAMARRSASVGQ